jgi:hypothetical protein
VLTWGIRGGDERCRDVNAWDVKIKKRRVRCGCREGEGLDAKGLGRKKKVDLLERLEDDKLLDLVEHEGGDSPHAEPWEPRRLLELSHDRLVLVGHNLLVNLGGGKGGRRVTVHARWMLESSLRSVLREARASRHVRREIRRDECDDDADSSVHIQALEALPIAFAACGSRRMRLTSTVKVYLLPPPGSSSPFSACKVGLNIVRW